MDPREAAGVQAVSGPSSGARAVLVPALGAHEAAVDVDWQVEPGARVAAGEVLAHLCVEGRCGLYELCAPAAGVLVHRWAALVKAPRVGDAVGVVAEAGAALGEVAAAVARSRQLEGLRLNDAMMAAEAELDGLCHRLDGRPKPGPSRALLAKDVAALVRFCALARDRLRALTPVR